MTNASGMVGIRTPVIDAVTIASIIVPLLHQLHLIDVVVVVVALNPWHLSRQSYDAKVSHVQCRLTIRWMEDGEWRMGVTCRRAHRWRPWNRVARMIGFIVAEPSDRSVRLRCDIVSYDRLDSFFSQLLLRSRHLVQHSQYVALDRLVECTTIQRIAYNSFIRDSSVGSSIDRRIEEGLI